MNFGVIDIIFSLIILVCAIGAAFKGFIRAVLSKLAIILGVFFAITFNGKLSPVFETRISSPVICKILSGLIIFIVVFIVVMIIQKILQRVFSGEILRSLDSTLGFFFGLLGGLIIVIVILKLLYMQSFFDVKNLLSDSFFNNFLKSFIGNVDMTPIQKVIEPAIEKTENILPDSISLVNLSRRYLG